MKIEKKAPFFVAHPPVLLKLYFVEVRTKSKRVFANDEASNIEPYLAPSMPNQLLLREGMLFIMYVLCDVQMEISNLCYTFVH